MKRAKIILIFLKRISKIANDPNLSIGVQEFPSRIILVGFQSREDDTFVPPKIFSN